VQILLPPETIAACGRSKIRNTAAGAGSNELHGAPVQIRSSTMAEVNVQKRPAEQKPEPQRIQRDSPMGGTLAPFFTRPLDLLSTSPFALMRRFSEEMDQLFGSRIREGETGGFLPPIEISEQKGKLMISADLPGIDKNDIKVELSDGNLVIQGERKRETETETAEMRRTERSYGRFYRSIPLPEGVNAEETRAQFKDGVLEISVPIPEGRGRRLIPVETGERK
jgi:HSP20 family protein